MSGHHALRHMYLSMIAAAGVGSIVSAVAGTLAKRNYATSEEVRALNSELKADLKADIKQLQLEIKAEMQELKLLIIKRLRCRPW